MAEQGDGQSTAAWTAVAIVLLAVFLICLGIVIPSWPVSIVGVVLILVGAAAGKILAMAGLGQPRADPSLKNTEAR